MALIQCPECGKEISDKADSCLNCGYIIKSHLTENNEQIQSQDKINNFEMPMKQEKHMESNEKIMMGIGIFCLLAGFLLSLLTLWGIISMVCGIGMIAYAVTTCNNRYKKYERNWNYCLEKLKNGDYSSMTYDEREILNVPKCPTCGSRDIRKISGLSKEGSVVMWGLFSQKVRKQWHCDNCGSEW